MNPHIFGGCLHMWAHTGRVDILLDGSRVWEWFKCTQCNCDGVSRLPNGAVTPYHESMMENAA